MKKLSSIVKENLNLKNYKYTVNVEITGNVTAENEGNAGELVDQIVDEVSSVVDVINYNIINIEEIGTSEIVENIEILNKQIVLDAYKKVIESYNDILEYLPESYKEELNSELNKFFRVKK